MASLLQVLCCAASSKQCAVRCIALTNIDARNVLERGQQQNASLKHEFAVMLLAQQSGATEQMQQSTGTPAADAPSNADRAYSQRLTLAFTAMK